MRYLSVCSGIEAATVAWRPLGFEAAAFSEIEKFPREVLQYHYPDTPCHGDFTTIEKDDYGSIDILVGGTPCQSFSIAGLQAGLSDDRGNLALEFIRLAQRKKPKWIVWENVPGVLSSNKGKDFASFLGGVGECGYGFAYRVLDAQYFGVPQRRRRVFVIGCLGDWRSAAQVLFEPESLQGNIAPKRKKGKDTTNRTNGSLASAKSVTGPILRRCGTRQFLGNQEAFSGDYFVTYSIQGNIIGRKPQNGGNGAGFSEEISGTLTKTDRHAVYSFNGEAGSQRSMPICENFAPTLTKSHADLSLYKNKSIRRLTPLECERLMGFPDNYTNIPGSSGSKRYAALGNSMAVPVMHWLGKRIKLINQTMESDNHQLK